MTTFAEKRASMVAAEAIADREFTETLTGQLNAYVTIGQAHYANDTAWMENLADPDLAAAANASWADLVSTRDDLIAAVDAAEVTRTAYLDDAWATISAGGTWPPA